MKIIFDNEKNELNNYGDGKMKRYGVGDVITEVEDLSAIVVSSGMDKIREFCEKNKIEIVAEPEVYFVENEEQEE